MGWSIGYDTNWDRHIGYGVPAYCDHPKCNADIDRGLAFVCGGNPFGGDFGCGLYFCPKHLYYAGSRRDSVQLCPRCIASKRPYAHPKPEHPRWMRHLLNDKSWAQWRGENPKKVAAFEAALAAQQDATVAIDSARTAIPPKESTEENR